MKNLNFIALSFSLIALVFFPSCDPKKGTAGDTGNVNISFKATYDGQPLVMNERYTYNGADIAFSKIRFYISELNLKYEGENLAEEIKEIDQIDITSSHLDASSAATGFLLGSKVVPVGTYDEISFGIGVSSDYNDTNPNDYEGSYPLNSQEDYWDAWGGYIFSKIEGKYDANADGTTLDGNIVLHSGKDANYRVVTMSSQSIEIVKDGETDIVITIDIKDILKNADGSSFDLATDNTSINMPAEDLQMLFETIVNNWRDSFSLN